MQSNRIIQININPLTLEYVIVSQDSKEEVNTAEKLDSDRIKMLLKCLADKAFEEIAKQNKQFKYISCDGMRYFQKHLVEFEGETYEISLIEYGMKIQKNGRGEKGYQVHVVNLKSYISKDKKEKKDILGEGGRGIVVLSQEQYKPVRNTLIGSNKKTKKAFKENRSQSAVPMSTNNDNQELPIAEITSAFPDLGFKSLEGCSSNIIGMKKFDLTLSNIINKILVNPPSFEQLLDITLDLLFHLKKLHDFQLLHLDIKPDNIMANAINENIFKYNFQIIDIDEAKKFPKEKGTVSKSTCTPPYSTKHFLESYIDQTNLHTKEQAIQQDLQATMLCIIELWGGLNYFKTYLSSLLRVKKNHIACLPDLISNYDECSEQIKDWLFTFTSNIKTQKNDFGTEYDPYLKSITEKIDQFFTGKNNTLTDFHSIIEFFEGIKIALIKDKLPEESKKKIDKAYTNASKSRKQLTQIEVASVSVNIENSKNPIYEVNENDNVTKESENHTTTLDFHMLGELHNLIIKCFDETIYLKPTEKNKTTNEQITKCVIETLQIKEFIDCSSREAVLQKMNTTFNEFQDHIHQLLAIQDWLALDGKHHDLSDQISEVITKDRKYTLTFDNIAKLNRKYKEILEDIKKKPEFKEIEKTMLNSLKDKYANVIENYKNDSKGFFNEKLERRYYNKESTIKTFNQKIELQTTDLATFIENINDFTANLHDGTFFKSTLKAELTKLSKQAVAYSRFINNEKDSPKPIN